MKGLFWFALLFPMLATAQDVDTWAKVEKARHEVPACQTMLAKSQNTGSVPMHSMSYAELDRTAAALSHCGFVFRIVGDTASGDAAGNESDRYDAAASTHMQRYLKAKGLWADFLKNDCRLLSKTCGAEVK